LMRVGGTPYLHTLISSVPTAANAGYYAEIVAERAVLRRLVEAGTRIVQLGYGAASGQGGEVDEVVDRAQAEIYDVTERRMGEVADAPLFIDDSPNLTMMEIRAKARRLRQRHDLRLVVVDYLQLMTSGKKVESRQQEVSEFSRSLKLLAKELEVPVVAISQLNRGPEQRTDKRPILGDI